MPHVRTRDFDCWYEEDCFADPWREQEVILIQHGFGRNGEYWRSWVPGLARHNRVIRRDMRAHGGSSAGEGPPAWTVDGLVADLIAFLDALGLERVHYVGESLGGITGIALGAMHPKRLHSITLVSAPLRLGKPLQDAMRGDYPSWPEALRDLGPGAWVSRGRTAGDPEAEWDREQWNRCDPDWLVELAATTPKVDVEDLVAQVATPTLVLAPAESFITPLEEQLLLRTRIPDAEIEIFEGRGHNIYVEESDRCVARLLRFLDDLRSRG